MTPHEFLALPLAMERASMDSLVPRLFEPKAAAVAQAAPAARDPYRGDTGYSVNRSNVAEIVIEGYLASKPGLFTTFFGGAAMSDIEAVINRVRADATASAVLVSIDSPGGSVLGVPSVAAALRRLADTKPTVVLCTGIMASGAYWIGAAAGGVFGSGATDMLGSIGVSIVHRHNPNAAGVTEIVAGKFKNAASSVAPLTSDGRAYLQSQADYIYGVFVAAVARNRGVSVDTVQRNMAEGRIFHGQQAVDAGLVDGIATRDELLAALATAPSSVIKRRATPGARAVSAPVAPASAQAHTPTPVASAARAPTRTELATATARVAALQRVDLNTRIAALQAEHTARGSFITRADALKQLAPRQWHCK